MLKAEPKKKDPKNNDPIEEALKNRKNAGGLISTITPNSANIFKFDVPEPLKLKLERPHPFLLDFTRWGSSPSR